MKIITDDPEDEKNSFREIVYCKKIDSYFAIREEKMDFLRNDIEANTTLSLYKITSNGEFSVIPLELGDEKIKIKISKDILENFLTIHYKSNSFFVLKNLHKEFPERVFGVKKLPEKKFPKIEKIQHFGFKKLAVCSNTGNLFLFLIDDDEDKISIFRKIFLGVENCENFSIFPTGEICCFFTENKILKIFKILKENENSPEKKIEWEIDLMEEKEEENPDIGSFDFVFLDFIFKSFPVIFALKNFEKYSSLYVLRVDKQEVEIVQKIEKFSEGKIVCGEVFDSRIYFLEEGIKFKVVKFK